MVFRHFQKIEKHRKYARIAKNTVGFGFSGSDLPKTHEKSKIGDQKFFGQNPKCVTRL